MSHKNTQGSDARSEKAHPSADSRSHSSEASPLPKSAQPWRREETLNVEAALSPFWAWRITSH